MYLCALACCYKCLNECVARVRVSVRVCVVACFIFAFRWVCVGCIRELVCGCLEVWVCGYGVKLVYLRVVMCVSECLAVSTYVYVAFSLCGSVRVCA